MKRTVRTTLVYGAISALAVMPAAGLLSTYLGRTTAFKLVLWADLAGYAALMARWSGKPLTAIMFPLALLLGTALWPGGYPAFFFLGLGVLSWLLAVPLSYPGSRVFNNVIGVTMFSVPLDFRYPVFGLLLWLVIVVVLSALASLWPALGAARVSVRESLAYE